jgi:hypothetical protein
LIYAYSWYLDHVCENWDALIENDYESVMPLTFRKKMGINYIFTPNFVQQLGVFSTSLLDVQKTERFFDAIPNKFKYIDLNINSFNKYQQKYSFANKINHLLDLRNPYEKIAANYSENLKRNLKKANNSGITITYNIKPEEIINIFIYNKGKEINNWNESSYLLLKKLVYTGMYKGVVQTIGSYTTQNELCAGAIFFISNNRAIFLFSATNKKSKELYAMPKIIDTFIRNHAFKNMILDFEGSNNINLARFYKSFGSNTVYYPTITINRMSFFAKSVFFLVKKFREAFF